MQIDTVIACGKNCESYIDFLIWTIEQTKSSNTKLNYLFGVNDEAVNKSLLEKYGTVFDVNRKIGYSSKAHGFALDDTFKHATSQYTMILDCDVAFVMNDWDIKLLSHLNQTNVIVGTAYDEDYHKKGANQKYLNWPNVIMCLFDTSIIRNNDISFMPKQNVKLTENNRELYGHSEDIIITRDTGCELSEKLREKYTSTAFELIRPATSKAIMMNNPSLRGEEHHINGIPFMSHLGRSSSRIFGRNPDAIAWEMCIRNWIENL